MQEPLSYNDLLDQLQILEDIEMNKRPLTPREHQMQRDYQKQADATRKSRALSPSTRPRCARSSPGRPTCKARGQARYYRARQRPGRGRRASCLECPHNIYWEASVHAE